MTQVYCPITLEAAAKVADQFADDVYAAYHIAERIRALPVFPGPTTGEASEPSPLSERTVYAGVGHAPGSATDGGSDAIGETVEKLREALNLSEKAMRADLDSELHSACLVKDGTPIRETCDPGAESWIRRKEVALAAIHNVLPLLTALEGNLQGNLAGSDDASFLWKWVERGLYDQAISPRDALETLAWFPGAPWRQGRWDVDHKPYASKFYADHPAASTLPMKED